MTRLITLGLASRETKSTSTDPTYAFDEAHVTQGPAEKLGLECTNAPTPEFGIVCE